MLIDDPQAEREIGILARKQGWTLVCSDRKTARLLIVTR